MIKKGLTIFSTTDNKGNTHHISVECNGKNGSRTVLLDGKPLANSQQKKAVGDLVEQHAPHLLKR